VDKFQGHEADIVFLSMVQTKRVGFMDNPNRLNVAITEVLPIFKQLSFDLKD
jgi:superfamily I DNA and/or RNA helicase